MKKLENAVKKKNNRARESSDQIDISTVQAQLDAYEKEKSILLALSNDITKVREKSDLINLFSSRLKGFFYFTHAVVSLIDKESKTYYPFLINPEALPLRHQEALPSMFRMRFPLSDPFIEKALDSEVPVSFLLDEIIDKPGIPAFIKVNYECGIKEAMMTMLKNKMETIGYVIIYSDHTGSFTDEFKTVLHGIAPHLSNAVSNIIINEEIARKEEEQSILLSLSDEIAALRDRNDLFRVVNDRIKKLFSIEQFGIIKINEDHETHSAFMIDMGDLVSHRHDFAEVTSIKYSITDKAFAAVINSEEPVILDVNALAEEAEVPEYVTFWKSVGFHRLLCLALKVGGNPIGAIFFNIPDEQIVSVKNNLLKAVCAQLAVAMSNILANEQVLAYKHMLEIENDHLKEQIKTIYNFSEIIGGGAEMQKVYRLITIVAETSSTVLLLGETGTGKELIARAIHNASPRKDKLMVKVNCAALPANLIESELFGHERGSFTGAIDRRIGKFELANNSTLFLDEIGEMPLEMQVKLLRVIQEREFERVGGKSQIKVNVRIIAATNRNLEEEVNAGRFRPDLYYRLNVFPIGLPSLRNRVEDIEPLANFFVERYSKITGRKITAMSANVSKELKSYSWPGNVRELEHLIERSILLTEGNVLREIQLPERNKIKSDNAELSPKALEEIESSYIIEVLKRCNGKISGIGGAADILRIPATTLHSKMKKMGISKADYFQNQPKVSSN
jgi:formate hydrogenlyase transcriptional activator